MKNLGILFGGRSVEHEISLISAQNVIKAINRRKYKVIPIGITKDGRFLLFPQANYLINSHDPNKVCLNESVGVPIVFMPGKDRQIVKIDNPNNAIKIDVVFPVLHGNLGEDGTVQSILKLSHIPFVGSNVLGSAIGMDKDVSKRLLTEANIPVAKFLVFESFEKQQINFKKVTFVLGVPMFVKPANTGSSVGINKVKNSQDFKVAIDESFKYDNKIIIEQAVVGREIECAVLGNNKPIASLPGEVMPHDAFYSYRAKYLDKHGADLFIPAKLSQNIVRRIQNISLKTFKVLECAGMARVDGFLTKKGKYIINEVNTIPGFTNISMYPKLWEASGIDYKSLVDKLLNLAIERYKEEQKLKTRYIK